MKKSLNILTVALTAVALSACSAGSTAEELTITDPWVKAVDDGMTAAFAELTNDTDAAVVIVSATTSASPMIELHETVADDGGSIMMQEKDGGFAIDAGDTLTLEPGGDHLMFMGVTDPLTPGAEVDITLVFDDGSTQTFTAVVKEFSGANEEYVGDTDHDSMDHDSMDDGEDG